MDSMTTSFGEVLLWSFWFFIWIAAIMAKKTIARIRPYSTAVAPEMSLASRLMRLRIGICVFSVEYCLTVLLLPPTR